MSEEKKFARELIEFIDASPSQFHAVENLKKALRAKNFKELRLEDAWNLKKGESYFTSKNDSALVAFSLGKGEIEEEGLRMVAGHTDSPTFKIKPNPELLSESSYLKLNTEVYGGPLLSTWFDRELSLAGRLSILGDNPLRPDNVLVDLDKLRFTIPSLAIHMARGEDSKLNPQDHLLPLLGILEDGLEKDNYLLNLLVEATGYKKEEILDFELYLYDRQPGNLIGLDQEFISIGKLDDLAMVHASMEALMASEIGDSFNMAIAFDNEEVGSSTKQGAASPMLKNIVKRIVLGLGKTEEDYYRTLERSFIISADQAHAVHPNYQSKADPSNRPIMNQGIVIKEAANQAYTTDSFSAAVYESICRKAGLATQRFTNRSDLRGGSTIGPISSSQLDIASVDIGNPILAMHSVRELGGVYDHYNVYRSFMEFYKL